MYKQAYIFILVLICCSGCFRRWAMTEKEINRYYRDKTVKPTFFTIENDTVQLFCATAGNDTLPPLLMIHGAPGAWYGSRNMMDDPELQQRYHIIAVDRLGYNKSKYKGKKTAVNSIDLQATAIHEALRLNRSFKTAVVMGSSYGAPIAAKMAIRYPGEFHHLIMLAPAIDPDLEKFWWFHRYIRSGLLIQTLPRFIRNASAEKFGHEAELRKLAKDWVNLHVPATVMQGGRDYIIEPENFNYAKKVLAGKDARFIFLPDASHVIRWQNPDTVVAVLKNVYGDVRKISTSEPNKGSEIQMSNY